MSHIFDALQRSEAEQSGVETPALSVATELIQAVERKATAEREMVGRETVEREPSSLKRDLAAEVTAFASNPSAVDEFPALQVVVPPQSRLVCLVDRESMAAEKFRF